MNNQGVYRKIIIASSAISFVVILLFVSLLGENNKADAAVLNFLKNIKKFDYERAERELSSNAIFYDKNGLSFSDFAFLLELSLISRFDILEVSDYQIDVKRNSFWIPYIPSSERMTVSVLFKKRDTNIFNSLKDFGEDSYVKDLFVLERKNGVWQIVKIRTEAPSIFNVLKNMEKKLADNSYYVKTKEGFILNQFEFDNKQISILDKRLYNHVLHKAIRSICEAS